MAKTDKATKTLQRFTMVEMKRSDIQTAAYNPRRIEPEARKGLKKVIKRLGLLEPLVVNKRSGNLVSGHQRLSILDEENKGADYQLTIALIDVDDRTEKEANVALNNASIQGDYDPELLKSVLEEINPEDVGFSVNDLNVFDIDLMNDQEGAKAGGGGLSEEAFEELKAAKAATKELKRTDNDLEYSDARLLVVIFETTESKEKALGDLGMDELTKHISEKTFKKLTGLVE